MNAALIRIQRRLSKWGAPGGLPHGAECPRRLEHWLSSSRWHRWSSRRRRGGITLIEVLVAVFVLTFGLMGIAMVIPAGRWQMVEAAKSDRSTACGRAVINDMQIRGWLDPSGWVESQGASLGPVLKQGGVVYGESFLIDPAFLRTNTAATTTGVTLFPYSGDVERVAVNRLWPQRAMVRRASPRFPASLSVAQRTALADRITIWADDLIYSLDDEGRPRQLATWRDAGGATTGAAYPILTEDGFSATGMIRLRANNEGKFTWAAMITPLIPAEWDGSWDHDAVPATDPLPIVYPRSIPRYEVSIVVFYRRSYYCPTDTELTTATTETDLLRERSVYARIEGGGVGGGDVLLFIDNADGLPDSHLNLRKNQWVMLKGLDRSRAIVLGTTGYPPTVCKWYRVVGVDDVQATTIADPTQNPVVLGTTLTGRGRYVTLAGPDWQLDTTYDGPGPPPRPQFDSQTDICEAAICDDVVGVFTTVVDVNSL